MIAKEDISKVFAEELAWIKDETLRDQVITVWHNAIVERGWEDLNQIPFTLLIEDSGTLIEHTKRVTKIAKSVSEVRTEDINVDCLIAGALLHDVGKCVEYEVINGAVVKSKFGHRFRHPLSGSKLAWMAGLPDEIVHIIYAHSHEGDKLPRSVESVIVNHSDFIDFHIHKALRF